MRHFPVFLDLADRPVVVVGGGNVAERKIALLEAANASISIVAPSLTNALAGAVHCERIRHSEKHFEPADLDGAVLCIAATGIRETNQAIAAACQAAGIPVNVVDDPGLCSFIMPAIIDRGEIVIAISSGGNAPVLARWLRTRLALMLPPTLGRSAALATRWRDRVREALPDARTRRLFWEDLFDRSPDDSALNETDIPRWAIKNTATEPAIIRSSRAEPDLITLRDLRTIRRADIVFHHPEVPGFILEQARRDAEFVATEAAEPAVIADARSACDGDRRVAVILLYSPSP